MSSVGHADEATQQGNQESSYSHEATVALITSFYELVDRAHLEGELVRPPPGGWPQFGPPDPADRAHELLRNIPYFTNTEETFFILNKTYPLNHLDFQQQSSERAKDSPQPEQTEQEPAEATDQDVAQKKEDDAKNNVHGIVQIAAGFEGYGWDLYIDTQRGAVIRYSLEGIDPVPGEEPDLEPLDDQWSDENMARAARVEESGEDDPLAWRWAPTYRIDTFFNMCIKKYLDCEWMPCLEELGRGGVCGRSEKRERIMRECGWPGEGWDKERAAREMDAVY